MCYLGRMWRRPELLEQIYGCFPSVNLLGRFTRVPNLGILYLERENRLHYNP